MIAWRYVRARRAEGGISTMTWISLVGIALAVAAMIITLAVRSGFRSEFVDTILGANAHVTVYYTTELDETGRPSRTISAYESVAQGIAQVKGVTRAAPLIRGQVMATAGERTAGVEVYGISTSDFSTIPRVADPNTAVGQLENFADGIAIGSGVARELGVRMGDMVTLISPNGVRTAFGTSPRINAYRVMYIFTAGRWDIDRTRIYMPFAEAQQYFNRDGVADEIEVMVDDPEQIEQYYEPIWATVGNRTFLFSWKDRSANFLRALTIEDNAMFIILSVLVLLSSMNIASGLIMLVKNKGQDIGILGTMGFSEASILRIFFLCGMGIGLVGTAIGMVLGIVFVIYIDPIFATLTAITGGEVWDPSVRGIYSLPAELRSQDTVRAASLSLSLSALVTYFPARRAARVDPVKALRNG